MLQPGPAPGRDGGNAAPPSTTTEQPADRTAPPGGSSGGGLLGNLVVMAPILIMVVVLFFISRADRKKRAQLESQLKKGDRVVTRAGLIGTLSQVGDRTVRLDVAPGVTVTMVKTAIEGLDGGDTVSSAKTDSDKADVKKADDKK